MPKYLKSNDYYQLYTEQIRPIIKDKTMCIKLPLSNLTRTSKTFNKLFEDELINKFIKESEIKKSFDIYFKIPKIIQNKQIKQIRIIPSFKGLTYSIIFTYIENVPVNEKSKQDLIMAIDLGINNLATCVVSNNDSFIIDGKYLKSINHFYNKQKAYLQSKKPNNNKYTIMEYKVTEKRNRKILDAIYKVSKQIIDYAKENQISEIIVGYNKGFKTNGIKSNIPKHLSKTINQNFIQIPLCKLKDRIKYLCNINGIKYTQINESYTSICSFYDNEEIKYHTKYKGKRITRSLFKTNTGKIINADINGALNIMAKSKPERYDILSYLRNIGQTVPIRQKIKLN
jgi:IS605 OrfB family transposase